VREAPVTETHADDREVIAISEPEAPGPAAPTGGHPSDDGAVKGAKTYIRWRLILPWLGAAAAYLGILLVVTWPLAANFGSATYGGPGDGWALIWQTHERAGSGLPFFGLTSYDAIAWPFGTSFPSGILLSNALTEVPNTILLALGLQSITAYNLMILAAGLASALVTCAALRGLGISAIPAFWGGLVVLVCPWELDRLAIHLALATLVGFPLLLLGTVKWIRDPTLRSGGLIALGAGLAIYTHVYYGLATALVLVSALPIALLVSARRGTLATMLRRSALLGGALAVIATPLATALLLQQSTIADQLARPLYLSDLALRPHLLVLPSVDNPALGSLAERAAPSLLTTNNTGELALFLGWVTIALAVVGLVGAATRRVPRLPAAVAACWVVVGLLVSLPAELDLPLIGPTSMPVAYLQSWTTFISTPARFFVIVLFGTVTLAALGLCTLSRRLGRRAGFAIAAGAVVFSLVELPVRGPERVVSTSTPPVITALMELVPPKEPVMQYPSPDRGMRPVAEQLFWQLQHGRPLVNGAFPGTFEERVRDLVSEPAVAETPRILTLLGVRWATFEPGAYSLIGRTTEGAAPGPGFRTVRTAPDGASLLEVVAPPAPGLAVLYSGMSIEGPTVNSRWLAGRRATLVVCATTTGTFRLEIPGTSFGSVRRLRVGSQIVEIPPAASGLHTATAKLRLTRGWQRVPLSLEGSEPTRPSDVVPGSTDTRPLSVALGGIAMQGPSGPPDVCRRRPADDLLSTRL
jgi:hypothetical protein